MLKWLGVPFAALLLAWPLGACPFCTSSGTTLAQEAASAGLIVYGIPRNARLDAKDFGQGTTDLEIEVVIKSHPILADRKVISLAKYIPIDPKQPMKYLVFCDVYKGQLDPYRGTPFKPESRIASYLKGAMELREKPAGERLKYYFNFLDDPDPEISNDAYTEFGNSDYKDFRPIAERLPADRVAAWINDAASPPSRLGLYGSMLGHCGKKEHAATLRAVLSDPNRMYTGGIDGVLAGLVILSPTDGWPTVVAAMSDMSKEYLYRYAALRAARFIWEFRPDLVDRDTVAESVTAMLAQHDLADLAIEDLRKWSYWKAADRVIGVLAKKSHDSVIMRRAVMRYALQCPDNEAAKKYVADQRKRDAQWVSEVESLLAAESTPPAVPGK
jgi:hypothetical protein